MIAFNLLIIIKKIGKNMSELSVSDAFGFHFQYQLKENNSSDLAIRGVMNITNFLGYLPVLGTMVGIARIVFAAYMLGTVKSDGSEAADAFLSYCKIQILRGIIELTSYRVIFIIPDTVLSYDRFNAVFRANAV